MGVGTKYDFWNQGLDANLKSLQGTWLKSDCAMLDLMMDTQLRTVQTLRPSGLDDPWGRSRAWDHRMRVTELRSENVAFLMKEAATDLTKMENLF